MLKESKIQGYFMEAHLKADLILSVGKIQKGVGVKDFDSINEIAYNFDKASCFGVKVNENEINLKNWIFWTGVATALDMILNDNENCMKDTENMAKAILGETTNEQH